MKRTGWSVRGFRRAGRLSNTVGQFIDHLSEDVLPPLLDRLHLKTRGQTMSNNGGTVDQKERDEQYIDPEGYWIDPARNVRRKSGEQEVILSAAENCSGVEWNYLFEAIRDCLPKMKV
jgi:hypothetical protein